MLRSDLWDFNDAYIIVKGTITVARWNGAKRNKAVTFKKMHLLLIASRKLMA